MLYLKIFLYLDFIVRIYNNAFAFEGLKSSRLYKIDYQTWTLEDDKVNLTLGEYLLAYDKIIIFIIYLDPIN